MTRRKRLVSLAMVAAVVVGCNDGASTVPVRTLEASGFFESDGLELYYESFGEGEPIILVHGWGTDLNFNWKVPGWVDALQSVRKVIAIDVRGHGNSEKPLQQDLYSYGVMANDVLNFMDTFGIEKADLMGYSMGSFMGAALLGHHTDRFTSMILGGIGTDNAESIALADAIAAALRAEDVSQISDPVALGWRQFVDIHPWIDQEAREALALAALQMWPEGFPLDVGGPGLSDVDIPVLIVNGSLDVPYVDTVGDFAETVGAQVVVLPDVDHFGAVLDPEFKAEVLAFLEANDSRQ